MWSDISIKAIFHPVVFVYNVRDVQCDFPFVTL